MSVIAITGRDMRLAVPADDIAAEALAESLVAETRLTMAVCMDEKGNHVVCAYDDYVFMPKAMRLHRLFYFTPPPQIPCCAMFTRQYGCRSHGRAAG